MPNTQIKTFDLVKQSILGVGANLRGQTYDVRRLTPKTNCAISQNRPIISGFPSWMKRTLKKVDIENAFFELLVYDGMCNNLQLKKGDVLTQTGSYKNDESVFTFAQNRPMGRSLFIRTEFECSLSRPMPTSGQVAQQPSRGVQATPGYSGISKDSEWFLTLNNGRYSFSPNPEAPKASVSCGRQPFGRVKDGTLKLPTGLPREHFAIYIPDIPGDMLAEEDRIRFPDMDVYEIHLIFSSNQTGLSGHICIGEKINV